MTRNLFIVEEVQNQPIQPVTPPTTPPVSRNKLGGGSRKRFAIIALVLLVAIAIPATIFLSQQIQDIRQRASGGFCSINKVDVVLVMDTSNSMEGGKLGEAKAAAKSFAATVLPPSQTGNQIAIASFDNNGGLNLGLNNNINSVNATIDSFKTPGNGKGGTCLECALDKNGDGDAFGALKVSSKPGNDKHIIILTDGKINRYLNGKNQVEGSTASKDEQKARDQASGALNRILAQYPNTSVWIVQYGTGANQTWVNSMRRNNGTVQLQSATKSIQVMYEDIANKIMGGKVIGEVYDDVNKNGIRDTGDTPMTGIKVRIEESDGTKPEEKFTDAIGRVLFTNRCPVAQKLTVEPKVGYEPVPAGSNIRPVPTVPEGKEVLEKFLLKKQENATSLVCDPTDLTLTGDVQTMKATLKDKDGNPLANKTIIWSAIWNAKTNDIIILTPTPGPSITGAPAVTSSPQL